VDTAGSSEEFITVGGGIRTGARTGVELNKKGEADEATDNNGRVGGATNCIWGAGEAVAQQANCIWLISGETVTLNFLKIQCPEWDQPQRLAERLL
jgi:hypothetical protein